MSAGPAADKRFLRTRPHRDASRFSTKHSAGYLLTHYRLLLRVTRNELRARYAGSLLGFGWVFLAPLLVLAIYAAVYLVILRIQRPPELASSFDYPLFIF